MSAISHGQGIKNMSRNYNDLSMFLQKSNEGGKPPGQIKSFGSQYGLNLINQNSSGGAALSNFLLSSLQKQKKRDTKNKDI